jgi:hypothetical protein
MKAMRMHSSVYRSVRILQAKTITFTQPNLIRKILADIGITELSNGKETLADSIRHADLSGHE